MRRVLTVSGLGPLTVAFRTSWDSFDCDGTVPARERSILELPAGPARRSSCGSARHGRDPGRRHYAITAGVDTVLIGTAGSSRKPRAISGSAITEAAR